MITLTSDEFAAIETGFRQRRRRTLLARLRDDGTIPTDLPDADALSRIDAIVEEGKALDIVEDPDVVRLAQIAFLPEAVRRHSVIGPSMMAVLLDIDHPAADRLGFIHRRILAKDASFERGG